MHLYWRLLNDKSSCTRFLIKVLLLTLIFQSQVMTSFFDTLAAYGCLWECPFTFAHTKIFIISITSKLWSHRKTCSVILNIDLTNDVDVSLHYRNTFAYHLKDHAKCFVPGLHIRIDMALIDIHRKFLSNGRCLKSSKLKNVSRNLIFVNAIWIVFEIAGITVKMVTM